MFRPGHYGVSLLTYAPAGGLLVAVGATDAALVGGAVVLALAMLPDYDVRIPGIEHRGPTHTLAFAALVGAVGWLGGEAVAAATDWSAAGVVSPPVFGFAVCAWAILAHLLADALTPMGIAPFWPVSSRRYTLSLTTADSTVWNYLLFALGVMATAAAGYLALVARSRGLLG